MSSQNQNSRREFFKKVFFMSAAGSVVYTITRSNTVWAADQNIRPVDTALTGEKKEAAIKACKATMPNYVDDVDAAIKAGTIKGRKPGESCDKCALFDMQKKGQPICALASTCFVNPKGSCNSWSKKA